MSTLKFAGTFGDRPSAGAGPPEVDISFSSRNADFPGESRLWGVAEGGAGHAHLPCCAVRALLAEAKRAGGEGVQERRAAEE